MYSTHKLEAYYKATDEKLSEITKAASIEMQRLISHELPPNVQLKWIRGICFLIVDGKPNYDIENEFRDYLEELQALGYGFDSVIKPSTFNVEHLSFQCFDYKGFKLEGLYCLKTNRLYNVNGLTKGIYSQIKKNGKMPEGCTYLSIDSDCIYLGEHKALKTKFNLESNCVDISDTGELTAKLA